jgi:1-acyl-sn-glycerol-3-phosphate acyltransferase
MRRPFLSTLIWCFGGYDIGETVLEKGKKLLYTRNLISSGYTVMLFPEGKIKKDKIGEFKKGMHMLVQEDIPLLLVRISGIQSRFDFKNIKLTVSNVIQNSSAQEKTIKIERFFDIGNVEKNDNYSLQ